MLPNQIARGLAYMRIPLTRLGDGNVVFIQTDRIGSYARASRSRTYYGRNPFDPARLVISARLDTEARRVTAIPVVQILQVGIVVAKIIDADRWAQYYAEGVHEIGQWGSGMGSREEKDGSRMCCDLLHEWIVGVARRT